MKKIIIFALLTLALMGCGAHAQTRFGIGFTLGEVIASLGRPSVGPELFINLSSSLQIGSTVGYIIVAPAAEGVKSTSGLFLAPYARFGFSKMKGFEPFIKVAFAIASISTDGKSVGAQSLWGSVGCGYDVSKGVNVYGMLRILDLAIGGDAKTSTYGIGSPSVGVSFEL